MFDKKITSLSDFLKGSIKQLQNEIDIIKNKCIVNDEKNGFVMRKVEISLIKYRTKEYD
jgi:hypothetical protein